MGAVSGCIVIAFMCAFLVSGLAVADVSGIKDEKNLFHHPHIFKGAGLGHGIYKRGFRHGRFGGGIGGGAGGGGG